MAKKITLVDDLDGSGPARTVSLSFDGQSCSLDLGPANLERLQDYLKPFFQVGQRLSARQLKRRRGYDPNASAIRHWAKSSGLLGEISQKGRLPKFVVDAWYEQQGLEVPESRESEPAPQIPELATL